MSSVAGPSNVWSIPSICLFAVLWCGAAVADSDRLPPSFENVTYTDTNEVSFVGDIAFTPCRVTLLGGHYRNLECASLAVPLNPNKPKEASISLFIGRLKAIGKKTQPDPLVLIQGGPGAASSETFLFPGQGFDKILQQRDLYIIDQRGTGKSGRLSCPGLNADLWEYDAQTSRALVAACLNEMPGGVEFYTSSIAVKDLELVREALGVDRWNLYGVSYGSRVAQHYLRRYPAVTRSVILDGVVHPQHILGPELALQSQRALDQFEARCSGDESCGKEFPELGKGIETLFKQLKHQPIEVQFEDFVTGKQASLTFGSAHLVAVIRMALYSPDAAAILPVLLRAAYRDQNFSPLARNAYQTIENLAEMMSIGMHNTVVCSEDVSLLKEHSIDREALSKTYMGEDAINSLIDTCEVWPKGPVDTDFKQPVKSDNPVLLLSGGVDPITPPEYAEKAAEELSNSFHVIAKNLGHGLAAKGCVPTLMAKFISQANTKGLDGDCIADAIASPVFIDFNGPAP